MTIDRTEITGLILAGGPGSRMGGVDKGLQNYRGIPLALHTMLRLAPHVGQVMINANRNLAAYESMGAPVWPDVVSDSVGPLAGWLTGLEHCSTPYMVTVPCDTPGFPTDLVARLAGGLADANAEIAMATTRENNATRLRPAFCLLKSMLLESLAEFVHAGQDRITHWTSRHRCIGVAFDDAYAFADANTAAELHRMQT